MRSIRKPVELAAIDLFARALQTAGVPPIYAPAISDRPDALFLVNGRPVAVECRYVSHPQLVRLLAPNNWPADRVYEVFLPIEPHLWVRDAIAEKDRSVAAYLQRTGADAAWLLLHSSYQHEILREGRREGTEFFELLRLGAHLAPHSFEQVWIAEVATDRPQAVCIFKAGDARPDVSVATFREKHTPYPLDHHWFANATVLSNDGVEKHVTVNLNELAATPVCLQPLEDGFDIDYGPILADPNRNANLKNLRWRFHDTKPQF